jgi:hypothetical protein
MSTISGTQKSDLRYFAPASACRLRRHLSCSPTTGKNGGSMRAQQVKTLICLFSVVVGFSSVPPAAALLKPSHPTRRISMLSLIDDTSTARGGALPSSGHAAQHQLLDHKRHILLYRLTQRKNAKRRKQQQTTLFQVATASPCPTALHRLIAFMRRSALNLSIP